MGLFKRIKRVKVEVEAIIREHNENLEKCENMTPDELAVLDDTTLGDFLMDKIYFELDFDDCENEPQRVYYTVVSLQFEVANGGLQQFFDNSSNECAPYVSESLEAIGATDAKALFDSYISEHKIDVDNPDDVDIENSDDFDEKYDEMMGDIDSKLLRYARENIHELMDFEQE